MIASSSIGLHVKHVKSCANNL